MVVVVSVTSSDTLSDYFRGVHSRRPTYFVAFRNWGLNFRLRLTLITMLTKIMQVENRFTERSHHHARLVDGEAPRLLSAHLETQQNRSKHRGLCVTREKKYQGRWL